VTSKSSEFPSKLLAHMMDSMKAEDRPKVDHWAEIQELARIDPACRNAVLAVQAGRMSIQESALALALIQTKRAMELRDGAVEFLRLAPMPPIVIPADQWRGQVLDGKTGPA
jgi:hypothetical protein